MSWCKKDIDKVLAKLETDFKEVSHRFFTEHDIHSRLLRLVEDELSQRGELFVRSRDGLTVSLVHHEYPTPFRCDMRQYGFRITNDEERTQKGGLYRRGHYDLVVLNPEFIKHHEIVDIAGKNYKKLCLIRDAIKVSPLLWVCEICFGAHIENDLPKNWNRVVVQDTRKVVETLKYKVGNGVDFAKLGSVLVFFGVTSEKSMREEEKLREFGVEYGFPIKIYNKKAS